MDPHPFLLQSNITRLQKKLDMLFEYLGLEYIENPPPMIKENKNGKTDTI